MAFSLPPLRELARHAAPRVFEGTVMPIASFYAGYALFGLWGALITSLVWSYGMIVVRMLRGEHVSGLLVLSAIALTVRSILAIVTSSLFIYFLQPTLGTFIAGFAFLGSALVRKPLTERLSADVVDLPARVRRHPAVHDLHVKLSLLWAVVFVLNGAVALWLLTSQAVVNFLVVKTVFNVVLVGAAIVVSTCAFKRCLSNNLSPAPVAIPVPA